MSTVTINLPELKPAQLSDVDAWLRSILWDKVIPVEQTTSPPSISYDIHRLKARLLLEDGSIKMVQGVREVFEIVDGTASDGAANNGKMVIIGRGLAVMDFEQSYLHFLGYESR